MTSAEYLTHGELKNVLSNEDAIVLIDVRNPDEFSQERMKQSVNLPLSELEEAFSLSVDDFRSKYGFTKPAQNDTNIILTCRSGRRTGMAHQKLLGLGYQNIRLAKGMLEWIEHGEEVISG